MKLRFGSNGASTVHLRRSTTSAIVGWALMAGGCDSSHVINNYYTKPPAEVDASPVLDAGELDAAAPVSTGSQQDAAAPVSSSSDAGQTMGPITERADAAADGGGASADAGDAGGMGIDPKDLELDLFGTFQNTFEFIVSDEQLSQMNQRYGGGGPIFLFANPYGDIYTPGGGVSDKTYVDHLIATNPAGQSADFGQTEVKLVGESSGRAWTPTSLPNFRVDTNEFTKGHKFGGYENVRFNNAVVGSIFREKFTADFYRHMGYPAPMANYAWVQSSVWGEQAKVPYVVMEVYKRDFCKKRDDYFGGECPNMWEFVGDFGAGRFGEPDTCQFSECDATRVNELEQLVVNTNPGPGYKAALAEYLDWPAYHQFQCLSWIFVTGDDALHNMNNFVLVERADGKFQYLPYSIDISFGFPEWGYRYLDLPGQNTVSRGCQADPECWADTVQTCDELLQEFAGADPVGRLDTLYAELETAGMLRSGDDERYQDMRGYIQERLGDMPGELDAIREDPNAGGCPEGQILCGSYCAYPYDCYLCNGGGGGGGYGKPIPIDLAADEAGRVAPPGDAEDVVIVPPPPPPPPPDDVDGGAPPPKGDGGVDPDPCLPYVNYYDVR